MQVSNNGIDYSKSSIMLDVRPPSIMGSISPAVGSEAGGTPLQVSFFFLPIVTLEPRVESHNNL